VAEPSVSGAAGAKVNAVMSLILILYVLLQNGILTILTIDYTYLTVKCGLIKENKLLRLAKKEFYSIVASTCILKL
jgi:hypothetical protein